MQKSLIATVGDDEFSTARKEVLTHMCSRPMQVRTLFTLLLSATLMTPFERPLVYDEWLELRAEVEQHMYFQHTTSAMVCNQALSSLRSLDGAVLLQRSSAGGEALQTLRSQCSSLHSLHVSHQTLRWHHRPPAAGFVAKCVTSNSLTYLHTQSSASCRVMLWF